MLLLVVTTSAQSITPIMAGFDNPRGLAFGPEGALYVRRGRTVCVRALPSGSCLLVASVLRSRLPLRDRLIKPCLGCPPLAFYRGSRDCQHLGRFLGIQAAEELALDNAAFPRVH